MAPSLRLANNINLSFQDSKFPDIHKVAKLFPISKSGTINDPSNYRPISILPVISKVIEKHITKHLFGFVNKYRLLHKAESGFHQRRSCS